MSTASPKVGSGSAGGGSPSLGAAAGRKRLSLGRRGPSALRLFTSETKLAPGPDEADTDSDADDSRALEVGRQVLAEVQRDAELVDRFAKLSEALPPEGGGGALDEGGPGGTGSRGGSSAGSFDAGPMGGGDNVPSASSSPAPDHASNTSTNKADQGTIITRFPFLSLLFRDDSMSDGILADESAASRDDNPIVMVFLWRDPVVSAMWLSSATITFWLLNSWNMSLLTLVALLGLWQLIVDLLMVRFGPVLQRYGLVSKSLDFPKIVRRTRFFSPKIVHQYADAAHELSDVFIGYWRLVILEGRRNDIVSAARIVVFVLLRSVSMLTTSYLVVLALFTLPVSLNQNRILVDALRDSAKMRWDWAKLRMGEWYDTIGSPVGVGRSVGARKKPQVDGS